MDATTGAEILLKRLLPNPHGTTQGITVSIPYRHSSGAFKIRAYDNVGNEGPSAALNVSVDNVGIYDPYVVTETAPGALSTGGTPLNLKGDDRYKEGLTARRLICRRL